MTALLTQPLTFAHCSDGIGRGGCHVLLLSHNDASQQVLAVLESLFNHLLALHTLSMYPYRLVLTYGSPDL